MFPCLLFKTISWLALYQLDRWSELIALKINLPKYIQLLLPASSLQNYNWQKNRKTASKPQLEAAASLLKTLIDHHFNSDLHGQIEFRLPTAKIETHQENYSKKEEICKAISYINKNYARDLTIKEVADHVYLSPFHFSRVFKNEIHVNFNTYLNQQRIKQAKNLLTQSSLSVNAISKEIGFSQTSYFCKIFRSFVGTTPAKYRKKIIS